MVLVTQELVEQFNEINRDLDRCSQLALKQLLPNKQLVLMTDASFTAAGYAILTEDDPNQKYTSVKNSYPPIAYGSETFTPSQLKMSIYAKDFLAIYYAFKEFGHIFWGTPQPVNILTDNKSVTRFFQTKIIPPPLWNACEFVIQFNFVIAHIPGENNTAADYLSRMEMDPEKYERTWKLDRSRSMLNQPECLKKNKSSLLKKTMKQNNRFGNENSNPKGTHGP